MHIVDQHNRLDRVRAHVDRTCLQAQRLGYLAVVVVDAEEAQYQQRYQDDYDPGALAEFRHGEDHHHDRGQNTPDRVERLLGAPVWVITQRRALGLDYLTTFELADLLPADHHPGLRHGEAEKYANCVE